MAEKHKQTLGRDVIYALATHWGKDHRTIKAWVEKNDPMLTHQESVEIIGKFHQHRKSVTKQKSEEIAITQAATKQFAKPSGTTPVLQKIKIGQQ